LQVVQEADTAAPLKEASLAEELKHWTTCLTAVVVRSCASIGWHAAAKGHRLDLLPQIGQEYLGIDVMAFSGAGTETDHDSRWPLPIAAFELENHRKDDRVAYSLWKVLCIRAPLRVVFAYRPDWEQSRQLVTQLTEDVIGSLSFDQRDQIDGETILVIGNRGEGETFPYGYFLIVTDFGEVFTPKGLNSKAQGCGTPLPWGNTPHRCEPRRGSTKDWCHTSCGTPSEFKNLLGPFPQGCGVPQPWALEFNPFGVNTSALSPPQNP
jgi:hypothetical protein